MDENNVKILELMMQLTDGTKTALEGVQQNKKISNKKSKTIGLLFFVSGIAFIWHEKRLQAAEARIDRLAREVESLLEERTQNIVGEYTESGD